MMRRSVLPRQYAEVHLSVRPGRQMAVVIFGGAYAVLAYVAQTAVENYGWLRPGDILDGLGMAETTPGPLIMVTQFVGFLAGYRDPGTLSPLAAATLGAILTTWVTFLPSFLWIFAGAPFIEKMRGNAALSGAIPAITAAVVGVKRCDVLLAETNQCPVRKIMATEHIDPLVFLDGATFSWRDLTLVAL